MLLLFVALLAPTVASARSLALWRIVHGLCASDIKLAGRPAPCLAYDREAGWAVLKDLRGKTQILLVPTMRVSGIESPKLLEPGDPNYWQAAWEARSWFERRAGGDVSRDDIGMAINSRYGRSQDQLHIHIDCVRTDVRAVLAAHADQIGESWRPLGAKLAGEAYEARRVTGAELGARDPFRLLAEGDMAAAVDMGAETLAVLGATFASAEPGFWLLAARGGVAENPHGSAETLLDHGCAVLRDGAPDVWPRYSFAH